MSTTRFVVFFARFVARDAHLLALAPTLAGAGKDARNLEGLEP